MSDRWTHSNTSVHNINYHLIWCTKYGKPLLSGNVEEGLKELLYNKASSIGVSVKALEIMPDHVHMLVQQFKEVSFRLLREEFPVAKSRLPSLWTRSYYAESVGHISLSVVRRYIEDQKKV